MRRGEPDLYFMSVCLCGINDQVGGSFLGLLTTKAEIAMIRVCRIFRQT